MTDVRDLAEFMFSIGTTLKQDLIRSNRLQAFYEFLERKKTSEGFIPVSKDSGLFICRKN